MNTKSVFFPCAGKGTRMGEQGKHLPKPLWPLFEKTLLEVQRLYATELGYSNFLINTHHLSQMFSKPALGESGSFKVYEEGELLGSGGCFHNLKAHGESGDLAIFNPDSFLILSQGDWETFESLCSKFEQVLIAVPCGAKDPYNRLVVENGMLIKIAPPSENAPMWTYSGFGKINLDGLHKSSGNSGFFDTVAKLNDEALTVFKPVESFEFWDFGTIENYVFNIKKLTTDQSSKLAKFLIRTEVMKQSELSPNSYGSKHPGQFNFSGGEISETAPGIYFDIPDKGLINVG